MKKFLAVGVTMLLVVAAVPALATTPTKAERPSAASFDVEGRVTEVTQGWFQLSVERVFRGRLAKGAKLRVNETASTRFLRAGKPASRSDLKAGVVVRVAGTRQVSGKQVNYTASTVTLLK